MKDLLEDENINITGFPDCLERKCYENLVTIAISAIDKVLTTSELKFLNHKITLVLAPEN